MTGRLPTAWTEKIEAALVDEGRLARVLWTVDDESDFGDREMMEVLRIRERLNSEYASGFSAEQIVKKWLEIRQLFKLKYAMNGYTLEDRGHHIRRDGSLKDDLNESWKMFKKLDYLIDPNAGQKKQVIKKY